MTTLALHVKTGDRVLTVVALDRAPEYRAVVDTYTLNHAKSGVVIVFDMPEAPEGALAVTFQPGDVLDVENEAPVAQSGNLRDHIAAAGRRW